MANAVAWQQHEFRGAFKRELDAYVNKWEQPRKGTKTYTQRGGQFRALAEQLEDSVSRRFEAYANKFELDQVAVEVPPAAAARVDLPVDAPQHVRLAHLEAELRRRSAEENQLRAELLERMTAGIGEQLLEGNVNVFCARQAAVLSGQELEGVAGATQIEQLHQQLSQNEMVLSATTSLTAELDKTHQNNRQIEEQRSRPLHPVEALLAPAGQVVALGMVDGGTHAGMEEGMENQQLAVEIERSQQMCRHLRRQFEAAA